MQIDGIRLPKHRKDKACFINGPKLGVPARYLNLAAAINTVLYSFSEFAAVGANPI
jgi:hypothetical protein